MREHPKTLDTKQVTIQGVQTIPIVGNPQERIYLLDTDLAWLGGIWDGEGSISLFTHREKNGIQKICPCVNVVNTDVCIINKTRKLLEELGCSFSLQEKKRQNPRHTQCYELITRNTKYIVLFLEAVYPYLNSIKKQKAEILLDYCKQRREKMERLPSKGSTPYDETDWQLFRDFQDIRSSETTREAS